MIKCILCVFATLVLFNVVFFNNLTKLNDINNICKIYYKYGEARYVEIGGSTYDLQNLKEEDMQFINPWTKELMDNTRMSDCMKIKEE
jgi:hypothetical protein